MRLITTILLLTFAVTFTNCNTKNANGVSYNLDAKDFANKISELKDATLLDVRTPSEYDGGHIANATNIDWENESFDENIKNLDKEKPVLIYCLSGGRSADAASHMRTLGFKDVYELNGGIMKWRSAGLEETQNTEVASETAKTKGLSMDEFMSQIDSDKVVLVDFNAVWCGPCKKLKPIVHEIENEMKGKVKLITIDVDENPEIAMQLKIDAIPVLHVYKKKKLTWSTIGLVDKAEIVKNLQ